MKQTTIHNVGNSIPGLGQAIKYGMKCGLNVPGRDRNLSLFSILISSNNILCNKANIDLYSVLYCETITLHAVIICSIKS